MTHLFPISALPGSIASEATFATCGTFLRTPRRGSAAGCDVAILGVPFDLATSNKPGARFAPAAIRAASAQLAELKAYPGGFDPLSALDVADLGDLAFDPGNPHRFADTLCSAAEAVLDAGAFLLSLGGDHFISYPLLKAHAKRYGPLALIQFDAHTDTWKSGNSLEEPAELNHGTMFARAIEEGLIVPENSVQVGIRTWVDDAMGMSIIDNETVDAATAADLVRRIGAITQGRACYITVDIDCLDPAYAPGTGTPVAGGMTTLKLLQTLRRLAALPIVGFDVVEVCPPYDHGGITALAAATVAYDQICRLAVKAGAVPRAYRPPETSAAFQAPAGPLCQAHEILPS